MTFDQCVDFVVDRLRHPDHARRATRDKVRKRIRYALGSNDLPRLDVQSTDVDRDALIYWARRKWPGRFDIPIAGHVCLSDHMKLGANSSVLALPNDLDSCHDVIRHQQLLLRLLEAKCRVQESVISDLRPDALRHREVREKNRESAKKPRPETASRKI